MLCLCCIEIVVFIIIFLTLIESNRTLIETNRTLIESNRTLIETNRINQEKLWKIRLI